MPYGTVNADLMTTSDGVSSAGLYGFKNRLINSDMRIDQRNAGASLTNVAGAIYSIDRWVINGSQASKFTAQRNAGSVTPPVGFINYFGLTSSSAYSILTADYFSTSQAIEGLNVSDLGWGTANAQTITVSFWVRSSLTGTFGGSIVNSAGNRSYPFTYTISAANTWEQKTITIAGDTSGTWLTTNGVGLYLVFSLGAGATFSGTAGAWASANYQSATGATSVVGTNGATFYITGVQLEKGSTATSFDYRPYGTELILCQRYYEKSYNVDVVPATNTTVGSVQAIIAVGSSVELDAQQTSYKTTKRAAATVSTWTLVGTSGKYNVIGLGDYTPIIYGSGMSGFSFYTTTSGLTQFQARLGYYHWTAESEL